MQIKSAAIFQGGIILEIPFEEFHGSFASRDNSSPEQIGVIEVPFSVADLPTGKMLVISFTWGEPDVTWKGGH